MGRIQAGYVYEASGAFFVRYYVTSIVDGAAQRVQRSERLCEKNDKYYARNAKAVKLLRNEFMQRVNTQQASGRPSQQDMSVTSFWEQRYLPYCEGILPLTGKPRKKPSTVRGYKQIWKQHLKTHFANITLQDYEPDMGADLLQGLTSTQGKSTLRHIKALGSSIFKRALKEKRVKVNPWHDVEMPDDAIESESTLHYTLAEAEDIVSALVDHIDCQLIMALSCFLGLRPGEIAALRWEDFDSESVHIRRSVVRGNVDTPKTLESVAGLPLIDQVRVPLELWRQKSGAPSKGWVFESRNGTPVDLHNVCSRIIVPHVEGKRECVQCKRVPKASGVWKTLYAGRRGAATAVIEANNGNLAVGQALLRHKSQITTAVFYKKAITPDAFKSGMKLLEAAANSNGDEK
jgi:integrase